MTIQRVEGSLFGKEVVSSDGRELGHLKDLEMEVEGWKCTGLVIKLNRDVLEDVHLRKPFVGSQEIVVASSHVTGVSDKIILGKSLAEFAKLTGATEDDPETPETD